MTHPNPSTALAVTVIDELVRHRVARFVICPGSRSTALAVAADRHPSTETWVMVDERSAGFRALGMGKASDLPAAVIVTSGTAVANLLPAVVEANLSRTPLLILSADRPAELQEVGANQTISQQSIFGDQVRWRFHIEGASDLPSANRLWRSVVSRAVTEAREGGPVHLNLAFAEPLVPVGDDGRVSAEPFRSDTEGRSSGAPWTDSMVDAPRFPVIELPDEFDTEAGLVVVGDPRLAAAGAVLAHAQGWPLFAEPQSGQRHGAAVGEGSSPAPSISTYHHLLGNSSFAQPADVIFQFGRCGLSRNLERYAESAARRVVVDPWGWSDSRRSAAVLLRAIPVSTRVRSDTGWMCRWMAAERLARKVIDGVLDRLEIPTEPRLARDVARAVGDGGRLVAASSMPIRDLDMFMEPLRMEVFANRGASGIDGFVSTAMGVADVPGPVPVALAGDLSLLHDANGFLGEVARSLVMVVANNDGGGIFSFLPLAGHVENFERLFGTPHHRDLALLARFHGLEYTRVDRAEWVEPSIVDARRSGGIHLIEVRTDRGGNVEVHRGITAGVDRALETL